MKIYSKTRKAHYWNEDRFINGKNFNIVLDGATPLKRESNFNEARWMVSYLKKNINRYNGTVKEKLTALCKDAFYELPVKTKDEDYLPSASACWVEFDGSQFSASVLGDCEVTVITKNNEIIRCYGDELTKLDNIALNQLIEVAKAKNLRTTQAMGYIIETLIKHRKLINKPNGYSALALSSSPVINERKFEFDLDSVKSIYLYSDGFSQAFEYLQIYSSHKEMFEKINDVDEEIKKIVERSYSDRYGEKYPRFKVIDDITVTKIDV